MPPIKKPNRAIRNTISDNVVFLRAFSKTVLER